MTILTPVTLNTQWKKYIYSHPTITTVTFAGENEQKMR